MSFPLLRSLGLDLTGGSPLEIIAAKIVLAEELGHLKVQHRYHRTGARTIVDRATVPHSNWELYCAVEGGITDSSRRNYRKWRELLQRRLRLSAKPESLALAELMARQPSTIPPEQRQRLIEGIVHLALLPQDSASSLRRESRTKTPAPPEPAETSDLDSIPLAEAPDPVAKIEALALAAGVGPENARRVAKIVKGDMLENLRMMRRMWVAKLAAELWMMEHAPKGKGSADREPPPQNYPR